MLKVYEYVGEGLALGAKIVVISDRRDKAFRIAKKWAEDNAVPPGTVELLNEPEEFKPDSVVYGWSGDY